MIQGIILAAGFSSRANTNKLSLKIEGISVIERIVKTLQFSCEEIIVVGGHYYNEIFEILKNYQNVKVIKNETYKNGMFDSVKAGVRYVTEDFLLIPGDYPVLSYKTCEKLIKTDGEIVVPIYKNKKGHPIFIRKHLIKQLLNESEDSNLKLFRDKHDVKYIEVDDEGILIDIDTMDDYYKIKIKIERNNNEYY